MIVTTAPTIEGCPVRGYPGVVVGVSWTMRLPAGMLTVNVSGTAVVIG